jgi:hypothetical protein
LIFCCDELLACEAAFLVLGQLLLGNLRILRLKLQQSWSLDGWAFAIGAWLFIMSRKSCVRGEQANKEQRKFNHFKHGSRIKQ